MVDSNSNAAIYKNQVDSWIYRLSGYASLPSDTDEQRLRKAVLILLAVTCTTLGVLWGIAYIALDRPLAGIFPLGYSAISTVSLLFFFRSRGYKFFCRGQLALILILPVLLQWNLGGFAASGAVIIWSVLAPAGALMFAGTTRAMPWFGAYVLLMVLSGIVGTAPDPRPLLPDVVILISFVLNIGGVSAIIFFLLKYFVQAREQAMAALEKEHRRVRHSLSLAMEVQQNLLPRDIPRVPGLDIAGTSIYCDETGGDYYDFLIPEDALNSNFTAVVGDVSGHGVSSALLMATARAFIRQRSGLPGNISDIVTDVNRLLARDVAESGGFMTLFYLAIDLSNRNLRWVRAGHDPAIVYDAASDSFEELRGAGMALGVDADAYFEENQKHNLTKSQIILLGTDGIWEARNTRDQMFGKEPIFGIIRANRQTGAREILTACFNALNDFLDGRAPEDDLTMIVIKIIDD